ncbi:MAG: hypothetical protein M5R36_17825 [Deltaproteobacteria bacterium]|nr:hypothetical protein [Deltaproteobacteria bacterium]
MRWLMMALFLSTLLSMPALAAAEKIECHIEDPEIGLTNGAYASWAADGLGRLDAAGVHEVGTILIHGRAEGKFLAHVTVKARFGPIVETLFDNTVVVFAEETLAIPVDLTNAGSLHPRQSKYVTAIRASVAVALDDGTDGIRQFLEPRFLAVRDGAPPEIFDRATQIERFPEGITDGEELAAYRGDRETI